MPVDNTDYTQGPEGAAFDPSYSDGIHDDLPFMDDEPAILDRSTLELWAECPYRAAHAELDKADNLVLVAGQLAHDAISHSIQNYLQSGGDMTPVMIREDLDRKLQTSRPDVQPEILSAAGRMVYPFSYMLAGIHPENILGFDGGDHYGRSGQLAKFYGAYNAKATSELDFLMVGDSPEVVECMDYKTGWKTYDYTDVAKAFQFQMHAVLIFDKYPLVNAIKYRVWNTRSNDLTYPVLFKRQQYEAFEGRLSAAVQNWFRYKDSPPAWPIYEKCSFCPLVLACPSANAELTECEKDPQAFLKNMAAAQARLDRMEALAKSFIDKSGKDLVGDGIGYGRAAPKREVKSPAKFYETKKSAAPAAE
jgi:hypothetical protein